MERKATKLQSRMEQQKQALSTRRFTPHVEAPQLSSLDRINYIPVLGLSRAMAVHLTTCVSSMKKYFRPVLPDLERTRSP